MLSKEGVTGVEVWHMLSLDCKEPGNEPADTAAGRCAVRVASCFLLRDACCLANLAASDIDMGDAGCWVEVVLLLGVAS